MAKVEWEAVAVRVPSEGEYVVVYNGKWLWTTKWTPRLADKTLPMPVTHWASRIDLPYPMTAVPSFSADPVLQRDRPSYKKRL